MSFQEPHPCYNSPMSHWLPGMGKKCHRAHLTAMSKHAPAVASFSCCLGDSFLSIFGGRFKNLESAKQIFFYSVYGTDFKITNHTTMTHCESLNVVAPRWLIRYPALRVLIWSSFETTICLKLISGFPYWDQGCTPKLCSWALHNLPAYSFIIKYVFHTCYTSYAIPSMGVQAMDNVNGVPLLELSPHCPCQPKPPAHSPHIIRLFLPLGALCLVNSHRLFQSHFKCHLL